jgi:RNA-directed DNA polymerase
MGLRLSAAKTLITSIDEGLDFLGWRIQRHRKPGTSQRYVYTYPAKKAVKAVMAKVKTISRRNNNEPLAVLLPQLNPVLHGWAAYFRFGVSSATFQYLSKYAWERVVRWIRRRRYCDGRWWPAEVNTALFDPGKMRTIRYRYRGTKIPTPWTATT